MRYDIIFNYDYLIKKIEEKYKETTLLKNITSLCKDTYYITPLRLRKIIMDHRGYFMQRDIIKISEALGLTGEEVNKCFFTKEENN